jgi:hypothetical protein
MSRLALIVPFRKRWQHLWEFVPHYKRAFKDVQIYIIEQEGDKPFNRAKLLNVGFSHFCSEFEYFAAHDVDMLCTKRKEAYLTLPKTGVAQLATHVQQFRYKMPFPEYLGGVTLFNNNHFVMIGGYSNNFWGYGGEDNEIYYRLKQFGIEIEYRDCWHQSLYHPPSQNSPVRQMTGLKIYSTKLLRKTIF